MKLFSKLLFLLTFSPALIWGQSLSLDTCLVRARLNYPLLRQYGLIEKTAEFNLSNAGKAFLPQVNLAVKATYQSAVTEIPSALSDVISQMSGHPFSFPSLSKDQYQAALEVNQLIWDGGLTGAQKKNIRASAETEKQKLEVDMYALNERIYNLYFGILLINEQLKQNEILKEELAENFRKIEAYMQNGVARQSDLDAIKIEQINARQRESDLMITRKSYLQILEAFTGLQTTAGVELQKPQLPAVSLSAENKRPELMMLRAQSNALQSQREVIYAGNLPKISAFVQGGYGRPGLNMFSGAFEPFYIGGLRLSWNLSGFYTQKNNLSKIESAMKSVDVQKETFIFNNDMGSKQQWNDIEKLKVSLKNDEEIIALRSSIKKASEARVAHGAMTVTDLLRDINAESMARQTKALHEIQLYMVTYQLKNNINN
ncbi:MAG: outer rane efflux protein [Bacteroidetes bacterium]|nr:outer rane efflux protein [Bacteroidota bacterium]